MEYKEFKNSTLCNGNNEETQNNNNSQDNVNNILRNDSVSHFEITNECGQCNCEQCRGNSHENQPNYNQKPVFLGKSSIFIANEKKVLSRNQQKSSQKTNSIRSIGSALCRICHIYENEERLISPCLCKGSLAYVHKKCLERWLSTSGLVSCELCHFQFNTKHKLKYKFFQSLRLWYGHPHNLLTLQADFLICLLLSIISTSLIILSLFGLHYFSTESDRLNIRRKWSELVISVFLFLVIIVYIVNLLITIKAQILPWYRWWKSTKIITLILDKENSFCRMEKTNQQRNDIEIELNTTILSTQC